VDLIFYLFIWIGKAILKAYRARQERKQEQVTHRPGPTRPDAPGTGGARPSPARRSRAPAQLGARTDRVEQVLTRLDALAEGASAQDDALAALGRRFAALGSTGRVFHSVIEDRLRPGVIAAAAVVRAAVDEAREAPPMLAAGVLTGSKQLPGAQRALDAAPLRIAMLSRMAGWREDAQVGGMLADTDAIAAALWTPLHQFAVRHDLNVPRERPVTAPLTGQESLWPDLLPAHTPLIVVPDDFTDDLYRQASVAHEIAHLVWLRVPRLAAQTVQVMDLDVPPHLLVFEDGRVRGSLHQPFRGWLEEIFCDAMTVALLGPSGLRGLVHSFARPDEPATVLVAHANPDGTYAAHPPPHLRVRMAAQVLDRMGFGTESQSIVADWDRMHRSQDTIVLPCQGGVQVRVGEAVLLDFIAPRLEAWFDAELPALAGFRIEAIPGWIMTAGVWARVRARAAELVEGRAFHDDGRVVLAAAIEARRIAPDQVERIASGLRRAVLGRDAGERRAADPNYRRGKAHGHDHRLADEIRDALILNEVLGPPAFRRGPSRAPLG
jgi:hypothetical protein